MRSSRRSWSTLSALVALSCGARTGLFDFDDDGFSQLGDAGGGGRFAGSGGSDGATGGQPQLVGPKAGAPGYAGTMGFAGKGGLGGGGSAGGVSAGGSSGDGASGATTSAGAGGAGGSGGEPTVLQTLSLGGYHSCILLETGVVRCWGYNSNGGLGIATTTNVGDDGSPALASDVDVGGKVVNLAAGALWTCVLLETGNVRCWGHGAGGQLGYGNTLNIGDDETPASAGDVDVGGKVTAIYAGYDTCAVLEGGSLRCWGVGGDGQLGYGNTLDIGDNETPATAGDIDVGGKVISAAIGGVHACALLEGGSVRCWGNNELGQLGYGNKKFIGDDESPASAGDVDLGGKVTALAAGLYHTCALLEGGSVRCWGLGTDGQLGYANTTTIGDNETPSTAGDVDVGGNVLQVSAGWYHTCALLEGGAVRCWGYPLIGSLGYGNQDTIGDNETPASAGDLDLGGKATSVACGGYHSCAVLESGSVRCWGYAAYGQLGYGNTNNIGDTETPASAGNVTIF